jgi:hypothetical protein
VKIEQIDNGIFVIDEFTGAAIDTRHSGWLPSVKCVPSSCGSALA